jgi:hypothetical protein
VLGWRVLMAVILAGVLNTPHSLYAATASVTANIEFAEPLQFSTNSSGSRNLSLPLLITVNNFGSVWIDRSSALGAREEEHDSVKFMGPNNQVMNFLTLAYNDGVGAMTPISSICSEQGGSEEGCGKLYGSLQKEQKNLYSNMDTVFLTNLAPSASKNSRLSLFDLCAVYQ